MNNENPTDALKRSGTFEGSHSKQQVHAPTDPQGRPVPTTWEYDAWPSGEPYNWGEGGAARGTSKWDQHDFHVDLGCGRLKKGRIGIDHFADPGVDLVFDLDRMQYPPLRDNEEGGPSVAPFPIRGLPIPSDTIESIISHHCLEHVGDGFVRLMDECYRILKPGGLFRIIVPLFPSHAAVADPDHKRYFCEGTFETFTGWPDVTHWYESFSTPYTKSRFTLEDKDLTPRADDPRKWWTEEDAREIRVSLVAQKGQDR